MFNTTAVRDLSESVHESALSLPLAGGPCEAAIVAGEMAVEKNVRCDRKRLPRSIARGARVFCIEGTSGHMFQWELPPPLPANGFR